MPVGQSQEKMVAAICRMGIASPTLPHLALHLFQKFTDVLHMRHYLLPRNDGRDGVVEHL
jgi:hypothetical protein